MLFINNLQDGIHPPTHCLAIQVSTVQGNDAYSPILFYVSEHCQKKKKIKETVHSAACVLKENYFIFQILHFL